MAYSVKFVNEDQLPIEHHWALIRDGADFYFVVKRDRLTPLLLAEGWAAYQRAISASMAPALAAAV